MLVSPEVSLSAGAGNVEIIESFNGVDFIENGIDCAMNLFAVGYFNSVIAVNGYFEVIISAYFIIGDIPNSISKLGNR